MSEGKVENSSETTYMSQEIKEVNLETQAKVKKAFRNLEKRTEDRLDRIIQGMNLQIKQIEANLDKKYGNMYKTLIHVFLTKQEEKIYNLEIQNATLKKLLEEQYTGEKPFDKRLVEVLHEVKLRIDDTYREAQGDQDGTTNEEESESQEEGQEELPNGIR